MTNTNVIEICDFDFDQVLATHQESVFVLFYTPTCQPCKEIIGVVNRASLKYTDALFVKLDTSVENHIKAKQYDIRCHPTIIVFKNSVPIAKYEGCPANLDLDPFIEHNKH